MHYPKENPEKILPVSDCVIPLLYPQKKIFTFSFFFSAGDITVHELLLEPKISFAFPQQLLSLWICEEKELVHEIAGLGELKSPWHSGQMSWLENHLNIINTYSQALEALDGYKGTYYKGPSINDVTHLGGGEIC